MNIRSKVVATVKPSLGHQTAEGTPNLGSPEELIRAGADALRVNLSHTTPGDCRKIISEIKNISRKYQPHTAILFDTKGPELRLSPAIEPLSVEAGQEVRLTVSGSSAAGAVKTTHTGTFPPVRTKTNVFIDDGNVRLRV